MKTEQAIKYFEGEVRFSERSPAGNIAHGTSDWTRILDASKTALKALREKLEREKPKRLTYAELREMIGEPVWVEWSPLATGEWRIVDKFLLSHIGDVIVYRHKPMEAQHGD